MNSIKGSMQHTAETIQRLSKMQYDTFCIKQKIAQLACGLILIYIGFIMKSSLVIASLCILFGCLLATGLNLQPRHRANKVIAAMKGNFPKTDYLFTADDFKILADDEETIPYDRLVHLGEDEGYLYLYISSSSAYMIDKKTIGDLKNAMDAISKGSGKDWEGPRKLSYCSLPAIIGRRMKKKSHS